MTIRKKDEPTPQQFLGLRRTAIALGLTRQQINVGRRELEQALLAIQSGRRVKIVPKLTYPSWASELMEVTVDGWDYVLAALSPHGSKPMDRSMGVAMKWAELFDLRTTTTDDLRVLLTRRHSILPKRWSGIDLEFIGTKTTVIELFLHWPVMWLRADDSLEDGFSAMWMLHNPRPQQFYVFRR